jgi:hypothetical protein
MDQARRLACMQKVGAQKTKARTKPLAAQGIFLKGSELFENSTSL